MTLRERIRRRKQRKAAEAAVKQAKDLNDIYANSGMTPEQVNQINSQVANIGGASQKMIKEASSGMNPNAQYGGSPDAGGAPPPPYSGGENLPDDGSGYDQGDFLEYLEKTTDPIAIMANFNRMYGKGSDGGKFYSEAFDNFETFMDLGLKVCNLEDLEENAEKKFNFKNFSDDVFGIYDQFTQNWSEHGEYHFTQDAENFLGIERFLNNLKKQKENEMNDSYESAEDFEIMKTITNYLPSIIIAVIGWYLTTMKGQYYHYAGYAVIAYSLYSAYKEHKKLQEESQTDSQKKKRK